MRRDALANNLKNKQEDLERVEVIEQISHEHPSCD